LFFFSCTAAFATIFLVSTIGGITAQVEGFDVIATPRYFVGMIALMGAFWVFSRLTGLSWTWYLISVLYPRLKGSIKLERLYSSLAILKTGAV